MRSRLGFDRWALASKNANPSRNAAAMLTLARSADTSSLMMWPAHIATRRVEIGLPPTICAAWARNRLRTAAQRLAQIRPAAMC